MWTVYFVGAGLCAGPPPSFVPVNAFVLPHGPAIGRPLPRFPDIFKEIFMLFPNAI